MFVFQMLLVLLLASLIKVTYAVCDSNCLLCATNGTTCQQCQSGTYLYGVSCLGSCPDTYYGKSNVCYSCTSPCKNCTSDTECTSCLSSLSFLYGTECITDCPSSTVPTYSSTQSYCNPCNSVCATCSGNIDNCTSCKNTSYSLYLGVCIASCPSGLFSETKTNETTSTTYKVCSKCFDNCEYCTTSTSCTLCAKGYYLNGDGLSCVSDCPEGYLKDSIYRICYLTQCPAGQFDVTEISSDSSTPSYAVKCSSTCPSGYYVNTAKQMCKACHSSCVECTGPNATDCLVCDSTCDTCLGNSFTQCLSCTSTRSLSKLFNQAVGECVCQSGTVEELEEQCEYSGLSDRMKSILTGVTIANLAMSVLSSFFTQNSIFLLRYVDFCQTLSYLGYVNMKYPLQMDKILKIYDNFNLGYLLPKPIGLADSVLISSVELQSNPYDSQLEYKGNPLFFVNQRVPFIAINAFSYLVLYLCFVFVYSLLRLVLYFQPDMGNLEKFISKFPHSIILNLLIITSQEMITHTFIQFTNFSYKKDSTIGLVSIVIGFILTLVMVVVVVYLIVRTKRKLSKEMKQSVFDATSKFVREFKEQTGMPSHFQLSIFVRKLFFSLSVAFLYQSAATQASIFCVTQILFMVYFYMKRPFTSIKHHRVASFIEISFLFFTLLIFIASFRSGGGLVATMTAFGIFLILFQCAICLVASYYAYLVAMRLIEIKKMLEARNIAADESKQISYQVNETSFQVNMTTTGPLDQSRIQKAQTQHQTRQQQLQTLNRGTARFADANGKALIELDSSNNGNASYFNETAPVIKKKHYLSDSNNHQQQSNLKPALMMEDDSDSEGIQKSAKGGNSQLNNGYTSNNFTSTYNSISSQVQIQRPLKSKKLMKTFSQNNSIISSDEASIVKPRRLHPLDSRIKGESKNTNNNNMSSDNNNSSGGQNVALKQRMAPSESDEVDGSIESTPTPEKDIKLAKRKIGGYRQAAEKIKKTVTQNNNNNMSSDTPERDQEQQQQQQQQRQQQQVQQKTINVSEPQKDYIDLEEDDFGQGQAL